MGIMGLFLSIISAEFTFQEDADSNQTSSYWTSPENWNDNDYDTYSLGIYTGGCSSTYFNYSIPNGADLDTSYLEFKTGEFGTINYSLSACDTTDDVVQFRAKSMSYVSSCLGIGYYNGTDWVDWNYTSAGGVDPNIYEDGVYWNITTQTTQKTLSLKNKLSLNSNGKLSLND